MSTSPSAVRDVSARELGSAVTGGWWKPLAGLVIGLLLALGFALSQPPAYESVATALVNAESPDDSAAERLAAEELAKSRAATYESLGNSVVVAGAAQRELGWDVSPEALLDSVSVVSTPETTGLEITATADTPERAQELAGAWRTALAETGADSASEDDVALVPAGEPTIPSEAAGISRPLLLTAGAALGLMIGIIVALGTARPESAAAPTAPAPAAAADRRPATPAPAPEPWVSDPAQHPAPAGSGKHASTLPAAPESTTGNRGADEPPAPQTPTAGRD